MKEIEKLIFKDFIKFFLFAILPIFTVITIALFLAFGAVSKLLDDCGGLARCAGKATAKIEKDFNQGRGK